MMVGETGLEPATPSPPDWCANHLRYSPTSGASIPAGLESLLSQRLKGGSDALDAALRQLPA